MSHRIYAHCANQECEAECGSGQADTHSNPGYIEFDEGAVFDDDSGDVFCSQDCYDECHPVYCVECGDERVEKKGDRCAYCLTEAARGANGTDDDFLSQHPQLGRKPVGSVSIAEVSSIGRKKVG